MTVGRNQQRLPGDKDFWLFIGIDAAMFSVLCLTLAYFREVETAIFHESQQKLSVTLGMVNTLILLSSSYCVASALKHMRLQQFAKAKNYYWGGIVLGLSFAVIKVAEYIKTVSAGGTYGTNDFFAYYYSFTGLHLFHVLIGMLGLWLSIKLYCNKGALAEKGYDFVESAGIYWHLVDAVWLFLFLLLYLNPNGNLQGAGL